MNDPYPPDSRPAASASDEHLLLAQLLHRLEQSDHLSLDELDAVILQADAAYKRRLARLERTRQMIEQMSALSGPQA
ncbi:MAG: hypothetical protein H7234_05560 [Herminiimonas sp.]|nr:hypothetical protein [Herminiimonas sp.]